MADPRRLDTSELGPVRVDQNDEARRALVVRQAIEKAVELDSDPEVRHSARWFAQRASVPTLLHLARLLKA
jgi:hypothetical protein